MKFVLYPACFRVVAIVGSEWFCYRFNFQTPVFVACMLVRKEARDGEQRG
jgi:hypothetical protein